MPKARPELEAVRSSEKKRIRNKAIKARIHTQVSGAVDLVTLGKKDEAAAAVKHAIKLLDGSVRKGVLHGNASARRKSRLVRKLNHMEAAPAPKSKARK